MAAVSHPFYMRYVTFVLIPGEGGIHPVDSQLAEDSRLTRELIHNINLLDDGTAVTLYQFSGDRDRAREIVEDAPEVLGYHIRDTDRSVHAYVHLQPTDDMRDLLRIPREHEIILDFPFEYTPRGGLRMSVIGTNRMILAARSALPDGLGLELEQTGEYEPSPERLFWQLTTRQQETLKAAIEAGYYEVPRQATYEDVADALDRTDGTVGEHLRKIESHILNTIVP